MTMHQRRTPLESPATTSTTIAKNNAPPPQQPQQQQDNQQIGGSMKELFKHIISQMNDDMRNMA